MQNEKVILVASESYQPLQFLANIAFYTLLYLILATAIYSIHRLRNGVENASLSSKIQFFIGGIFLIPILSVIISILQVLNGIYVQKLTLGYEQQARNMAEQVAGLTLSFEKNEINRDQYYFELRKAAGYGQSDLIVYDRLGRMLATSRSEMFRLYLLDDRINPKAFQQINAQQSKLIVVDEQIGNLDYKNVYIGIYEPKSGKNIGFLSLPFFNFQNDLALQQQTIFQNLIVLITCILVLTMFASQYSLKKIIQPIKTIANRLRETSYLSDNVPILTYQSKDEIGQLVAQYNLMVEQLSESKLKLLAIQKESAWKEIARQVAHEIKNPLTPMRLKIQQLQRRFDPNTREYSNLESLVTQVDTLAMIADSFSEFAKMPAPQNEPCHLSNILATTVALFQSDDVLLESDIAPEIMVYADPKVLSQIFNNLILNAIQAHDTEKKSVTVTLTEEADKALISIADQGTGIDDEEKEKIFKPYFSTKSSGSGIGLALAKKGVEQANGSIWFDSERGKGTTFYISLPIYQ